MANIPTTSTTLLRDLAQDSQHARWGEFDGMSKGRNWWRIKGPEGIPELMAEELDSPAYSATMESF